MRTASLGSKNASGRVTALSMRHAALEAAIDSEHLRPVPDMAALQKLKRTRLAIKQELHRLLACEGSGHAMPRAIGRA